MLDQFFNKDAPAVPVTDAAPPPHTLTPEDEQRWHDKILAAGSDDAALLKLAHDAPTVPLKLTAIKALSQEPSFKQAMHDFRDHDKRLYRAAKSRLQTASDTRLANTEAATLIAAARTLLEQPTVPVNRVVELDQAWAAVNVSLLDTALPDTYAALSAQLAVRVREHGEHAQTVTRWLSAATTAMTALRESLPGVAQGVTPAEDAQTLAVSLLDLVQNLADAGDTRCREKAESANRLLALASSVVQRATFLQALPAADAPDEAAEKLVVEQWRGFPEMSEGELHTVLATRFADWRNAGSEDRRREHETQSAEAHARRVEQNKQRVSAIERDVAAAQTAQADGHITDLTRLLATIDRALKRGSVSPALTQRIDILRAEQRNLQDWQRWGGRQGREQLLAEAQVLATQAAGKIAVKPHAEAIDKLRERWKELDKLGGASNQALWLAFDGALTTAHAPVAAHLDKLKQARQENLTAREQIVNTLIEAAARFFPAAAEGAAPAAAPDWRAVSHAVEDAQLTWRKLGPVEHTVPRKAQQGDKAVTVRYAAAVAALNAPLKNAYAEARHRREQLIAETNALAASDVMARNVVDNVRQLQVQWQVVAKAQSLPRRDENALWTAFKTATDAIFSARDASRAAKEAESNAQEQARIEVIGRVTALAHATDAAEIKRGMADAETAWRAAPPAPRPQATKLDARYRTARDAASKRLGELATLAAQARYDALLAAMALCDIHEAGARHEAGAALDGELEARWHAIEHFPDAWKSRLEARLRGGSAAPETKPNAAISLPDTLLRLEVACGIESPADFQADRQRLKILALKNAMEGRQVAAPTTAADIERWLLDAAAAARPDALSRERLANIIASVRNRRML